MFPSAALSLPRRTVLNCPTIKMAKPGSPIQRKLCISRHTLRNFADDLTLHVITLTMFCCIREDDTRQY